MFPFYKFTPQGKYFSNTEEEKRKSMFQKVKFGFSINSFILKNIISNNQVYIFGQSKQSVCEERKEQLPHAYHFSDSLKSELNLYVFFEPNYLLLSAEEGFCVGPNQVFSSD